MAAFLRCLGDGPSLNLFVLLASVSSRRADGSAHEHSVMTQSARGHHPMRHFIAEIANLGLQLSIVTDRPPT
jgi:hypothetical protein